MDRKEKLFQDIEHKLETFQFYIRKMKKADFNLHPIDVDLLKKKTIELYDKLNELDFDVSKSKENKPFNLPERTPKGEITEKSAVEESVEKDKTELIEAHADEPENNEDDSNTSKQPEHINTSTTQVEPEEELPPKADAEEKTTSVKREEPEQKPEVEVQAPVEEKRKEREIESQPHRQPPPVEKRSTTQSAFDLFTANAEKTVGDKLGTTDESSVADRMQKTGFIDLRKAIGINEKFLFINELFNGDMSRYNKAIDELNNLKTQQGINAYLLELKIANQWPDDNEAFLILKSLLDRKTF